LNLNIVKFARDRLALGQFSHRGWESTADAG
jgi:hypothetical protein